MAKFNIPQLSILQAQKQLYLTLLVHQADKLFHRLNDLYEEYDETLSAGKAQRVFDLSRRANKRANRRFYASQSYNSELIAFLESKDPDKYESIASLNLTVRATNVLRDAGIYNVEQLLKMRSVDVLKLPNSHKRVLTEIQEMLSVKGLTLLGGYCG